MQESISVKATRKYENKADVEAPMFANKTLTIALDGLVELTAGDDAPVTFHDFGTCPHAKTHFLTPTTLAAVKEVARKYLEGRGVMLSINDASLEFGGVIDNRDLIRLTRCHVSHRQGIDIDINGDRSGGLRSGDTFTRNQTSVVARDWLDDFFDREHMGRVPSAGLHWRLGFKAGGSR